MQAACTFGTLVNYYQITLRKIPKDMSCLYFPPWKPENLPEFIFTVTNSVYISELTNLSVHSRHWSPLVSPSTDRERQKKIGFLEECDGQEQGNEIRSMRKKSKVERKEKEEFGIEFLSSWYQYIHSRPFGFLPRAPDSENSDEKRSLRKWNYLLWTDGR